MTTAPGGIVRNAIVRAAGRARVTMSRAGLRPGEYSGDYDRLAALYAVEDPWRLLSPSEVTRFAATNAVIAGQGPIDRLLELGSGEGAQTAHLLTVARQVTGIEISDAAIARAGAAAPGATFHHGSAEDVLARLDTESFDIATACEILYYLPQPDRVIAELQRVAPILLVTNYEKGARRLGTLFDGPDWRRLSDIVAGAKRWRCHLWRRAASG